MTDAWKRPDVQDVADAYRRLFSSQVPLAKLKNAAFGGRLFGSSFGFDGIAGRGMAWKLFLLGDVPLTEPPSETFAKAPIQELRNAREEYTTSLLEKMRAPDGSYEEGFSVPGVNLDRPSGESSANLDKNNPLSLHEDNPWKEWFASVDLRRTIRQDVERTFPDIEYFRNPDVQNQLTTILYLHSSLNPDIGYRQGMHELLAPVFLAVDYDSITDNEDERIESDMKEFCSRTWIAADSWALFKIIMAGVSTWYEWREPQPTALPPHLEAQYRHGPTDNQGDLRPYVAPIVLTCQQLQSQMLKSVDPVLWQAMQKAGIEPQIYGIRWLRLLFTREFGLSDAMMLWDGIFSADERFELVPWICVAMLIRIRNQLIPADYSGQLTSLLRYSATSSTIESSATSHMSLLLRQAILFLSSPNPASGAAVVVENKTFLGLEIEIPEPEPQPQRRRVHPQTGTSMRRKSNADLLPSTTNTSDSSSRHPRGAGVRQSLQLGLPEMIARGLMEKGESLGINKTVMNAVAELRKNMPDITGQLMRTPATDTAMYSSFPLAEDKPQEERPPWEPKTRFEMEREISELQSLRKRVGDAVGVAVDSLLLDEGEDRDEVTLKSIRERKREALESLSYIRDILRGPSLELNDERLYGEIEYRKRKDKQRSAEVKETLTLQRSASHSPPLRPPEPAASKQTSASERSDRSDIPSSPPKPSHPLVSLPRSPPVIRSTFDSSTARPHSTRQSIGQSATLPRHVGASTTSRTGPPPQYFAPWNHTRSSFSSPNFDSANLPRPPPRTSSSSIRPTYPPVGPSSSGSSDQAPRQRQASTDPLGVVPHSS
ncbi:hypothetical protein SCHPADRAFT_844411 [Schizopora paradoxa]|uniref:Rab-GAP TBC domain-containing protein n=1 Tax=Schizopora paradoxa TaxID=27342 RepID=A0A0H2SNX5_9AGAM|nr:hypothetical protein SCHPADRAFT_844411 [Schizopora paradoxa]